MGSFDELIPELMEEWDVPGGAVAVVRDGRLVFARGYGLADVEQNEPVSPDDRFRIASVSKPVTAVTVLQLVEDGRLQLDDGAFDILDDFKPSSDSMDSRIDEITVRMLLQHSAGWDIDELGFDPMFEAERIASAMDEPPPATAETIIRFMLKQDLNFDPGTEFAYSNFGYNVLGRIIEAVTGDSYEAYVTGQVLDKMDISRMTLGKTRLENRAEDEVRYYGNSTTDSVFPGGDTVPWPYGGFYLQCMDAHGGWIGSAIDLLRFMTHVDDRGPEGDVLSADTLELMTDRPDIPQWTGTDYYYGMGWSVRPAAGNWWHNGSLPGTSSILVRANQGDLAWAAVFNSRPPNWGEFDRQVDRTLWNAVENVTEWPDHDLFDRFD